MQKRLTKLLGSICLALILVLNLVACSQAAPAPSPAPAVAPAPAPTPAPAPAPRPEQANSIVLPDGSVAERMIVRTGNLNLIVDDVAGSLQRIVALSGNINGYVVSSQ